MNIDLLQGNCLEVLKNFPDNFIDSIVTDPPYGLNFMNKKWDYDVPSVEIWKEVLRVLKPGGHMLVFGGTRTYHRLVCNIEDAGFEIRDQIQWLYGSGFPKSMNIAKSLDGLLGEQSKGFKTAGDDGRKAELKQNLKYRSDYGYKFEPTTPEAKQWNGWGTALKPANEPICLARKPLSEKNIASNVLKHGVGGINIDDCRIETDDKLSVGSNNRSNANVNFGMKDNKEVQKQHEQGRFPANVILDEEAGKMLDEQSGDVGGRWGKVSKCKTNSMFFGEHNNSSKIKENSVGDTRGGASRFFYCAKASKKERGEVNTHPTVKPIKLMEYLVKLITPPDGIVLDPFTGSGSTGLACKNLGFNFIGIEMNEEYVKIAKARLGIE